MKSNASASGLYKGYVGGSKFYVPTTVFTDASGSEIGRIVGYLAPVEFLQRMQSVLAGYVS